MEAHILSLLALLPPAAAQGGRAPAPDVPVRFEENRGQADTGWDYVARTPLYTLGIARMRCALRSGGEPAFLDLVGASGNGPAEPEEPRATRVSRVAGRDPARWSWHAPTWSRVRYADVWPGIDVVWRAAGGHLEYDFELAAGARVADVRLRFGPDACVSVAEDGALAIELGSGELRQPAPRTWEVTPQGPRARASRFVPLAADEVGFAVDGWDGAHALVIDPALDFLTLFGARGEEFVGDVDVDEQGLIHVCGTTRSEDFPEFFPANIGAPDDSRNAFLFVFDDSGLELLHALTIGGSDLDRAFDVDATRFEQAFLCGETFSSDFPVAAVAGRTPFQEQLAGESDAWVAHVDLSIGALTYSTYLGGESFDEARAIAVDAFDRACVTGTTRSNLFPIEAAAQPGRAGLEDAFLARVALEGDELDFSTYDGGPFRDAGRDVALDEGSGQIVICGTSDPGEVQFHDAFVQAFGPDGTLGPRGLITAGASVEAEALAIGTLGDVWVCGNTRADDLPLAGAIDADLDGPQDAWIARFDESLSGETLVLEFSTYWGGESVDRATGIAVDGEFLPDVYLVGTTESRILDTVAPISAELGGPSDAFVLHLASSNDPPVVRFASYFPAGDAEDGLGLALDALDRPVIAGELSSGGTRPDALASAALGEVTGLGNRSAFVARILKRDNQGPGTVSFGIVEDTTQAGDYAFHLFRTGGNELPAEVDYSLLASEATILTGSVSFRPGESMAEERISLAARDEPAPQYVLVLTAASDAHQLVQPSQLYLTVTPEPTGGGGGSGDGGDDDGLPCVGENLVSGTRFHDDLDVLRRVRDRWLAPTPLGRGLTHAYYRVLSPLGNRWLAQQPWIKGPAALALHLFVLALSYPLAAVLLALASARLLAARQRLCSFARAALSRALTSATRSSSPAPSALSPSA